MAEIKPMIFFGPGQCLKCGGQIYVADMETSLMLLSPIGSPIAEETIAYCSGVCNNCGRRIPMMRDGLNYIPKTEYSEFVREYNNKLHTLEVEARMEKLKPTKDNPFCINTERQK